MFDLAPDFCRAVIVATVADNPLDDATLTAELLARVAAVKADDAITVEHPRIVAWAEAYRRMPVASRIRPSIANLVRRVKTGDVERFPFISSLVAISNLLSLTYLTPSGLIDAAKTGGDVRLAPATGDEVFVPFGRDAPEPITPGEVIYFDTASREVLCRGWNSQGGKNAGIEPATRTAVVDIDSLGSVLPRSELEAAVAQAATLLETHCGATNQVFYLDATTPSFDCTY